MDTALSTTETSLLQWLFQQGALGIVLILVLMDYRRQYRYWVLKLEKENGMLTELLRNSVASNVGLEARVGDLVEVIRELNPRERWKEPVRPSHPPTKEGS